MQACKNSELEKPDERSDASKLMFNCDKNYFQLCYLKLKKSSPPVYVSLPSCIACHRCGSMMRLGIRKYKVNGAVRELRAYRCSKKGCQTFRSPQTLIYPKPLKNAGHVRNVRKTSPVKRQQLMKQEEEKYSQSLLFPWLKVSRYSTTFELRVVKFLSSGVLNDRGWENVGSEPLNRLPSFSSN
ncbi:unnamed protein product [Enterobius vermicularis]|uniref:Ogr_Delta domain-containing protein n=1 Tax=Enterobius vermicularis TaxID=51028 RepID=A0A158Q9I0_ENTVE|nr:unnamed protein product [Enterobius vermicularis]